MENFVSNFGIIFQMLWDLRAVNNHWLDQLVKTYCLLVTCHDESCSLRFRNRYHFNKKWPWGNIHVLTKDLMIVNCGQLVQFRPNFRRLVSFFVTKVTGRKIIYLKMRLQVLTATSMKMTVFWDAALYSLVEIDLIMEAVSASEMSVNFHQSTRRIIPGDSHLHKSTVC
jgi:hypothetical protein